MRCAGSGSTVPSPSLRSVSWRSALVFLSLADQPQWVLTDARGINDLGQIVGTGLFQWEDSRIF
jgi:hypothetical protein